MKLTISTLAVCLMLAIVYFSTRAMVRKEARLIRSALVNQSADAADAPTANNLYSGLEALGNQLASLNRRMTVLEDAINSGEQQSAIGALRSQLTLMQQELKKLSTAQARLGVLPGYLTDLTRYLDGSFAHLEKSIAPNTTLEVLAEHLDETALRIENIENLFIPLYHSLGLADDGNDERKTPALISALNDKVDKVAQETTEVRRDLQALRKWMTPRNLEPGERPD